MSVVQVLFIESNILKNWIYGNRIRILFIYRCKILIGWGKSYTPGTGGSGMIINHI